MLTAVLDTQVILRGATAARPTVTARIYEAWDAGRFTLLLSAPILDEIEDVVSRAEVRRRLRMTAVEAAALVELVRRRGTVVTPTVRIACCRDPDDVIETERFIRPGRLVRPSALDPFKTFIPATLEQYPRLRATRLWTMVRERGYPGSAIQVSRYVRTVRPAAQPEASPTTRPAVCS